jgi:ribosome recycling factor
MAKYNYLNPTPFIEELNTKLSTLRTSRINASILDNISVFIPAWEGYFKINELATINVPMPSTLMITPYDAKASLNLIEKAVSESNLNVNPVNDGAGLKIIFPPLTTEDRTKRARIAGGLAEEIKIKVRNKRRDLIDTEKQLKEKNEISEDQLKAFEKDLQVDIDNLIKEIDTVIRAKQDELMAV